MKKIRSESEFLLKLLARIILWPFRLVQVLLGRKRKTELFKPWQDLVRFVFEPRFTITIIIINIAIFLLQPVLVQYGFFNRLILYPVDLLNLKFYTLFTAGFLHANLAHLLGNVLALFVFGRIVERKFGAGYAALIYFGSLIISGIFSSLIYLAMGQNTGGLGASGAIMGLVAAAILIDPFYLVYEFLIPLPVMVLGWITLYADITGVINPRQDGIGHFAHLGGFLAMTLLIFFMNSHDRKKMVRGFWVNIASLAVIIILHVLIMHFTGFKLFSLL